MSTPGKVRIELNAVDGLSLWVDGTAVEPKPTLDLDLTAGVHVLTFAVSLEGRKEGLSCIVRDVPGSAAKAQPVVGK